MITPTRPIKRRNPLALLARRRLAGSHRPSISTMRRRAARELKRDLDTMKSFIP